MSGSGTNRLVQSQNAMKKGSESALASALKNANQEAMKSLVRKGPKKPKK